MRILLIVAVLSGILSSCKKNNAKAGEQVEMYLLKSFQMLPSQCKVDSSTAILESSPILANDDIRQYDRSAFMFSLKPAALERVKKMGGRSPFAVTVDKKVIYYGVYMPLYLSSVCFQSISMYESFEQPNAVSMRIVSGGVGVASPVDDQRNNPVLVASLRKQGKLK